MRYLRTKTVYLLPIAINYCCDDSVNYLVEIRLAEETIAMCINILYVKLAYNVGYEV